MEVEKSQPVLIRKEVLFKACTHVVKVILIKGSCNSVLYGQFRSLFLYSVFPLSPLQWIHPFLHHI